MTTEVVAGEATVLVADFEAVGGGGLVDLDAAPTIAIAHVGTGAVALAATSTGVTHPGTGTYGYTWTPSTSLTPGLYLATWTGQYSGDPVTATELLSVVAAPSGWAPDYTTVPALRNYIRTAGTMIDDTRDDDELAEDITTASRAVDLATGRQFGRVTVAEQRLYTAVWDRHARRGCGAWLIPVDDFQTTTDLVITIAGTELTDYTKLPVNAAQKGRPWEAIEVNTSSTVVPTGAEYEVAGVARWGWSAFPAAAVKATKMQAHRFGVRRDSPYGIAGSPDQGSELRLLDRIDPDVRVALRPYKRWWAAR